jgi:4-aminobutyrate aminotransferase-like enzyme
VRLHDRRRDDRRRSRTSTRLYTGTQTPNRIIDLASHRRLFLLGCGESTIRLSPPLIDSQYGTEIALDILQERIAVVLHETAMSSV